MNMVHCNSVNIVHNSYRYNSYYQLGKITFGVQVSNGGMLGSQKGMGVAQAIVNFFIPGSQDATPKKGGTQPFFFFFGGCVSFPKKGRRSWFFLKNEGSWKLKFVSGEFKNKAENAFFSLKINKSGHMSGMQREVQDCISFLTIQWQGIMHFLEQCNRYHPSPLFVHRL